MKSEIKWKESEAYELAITQWLVSTLQEQEIKETHFSRDAGLGKNETDARTFRKLKEGNRHWSVIDLCKLAGYFGLRPSDVLSRVESFYEKKGIVVPGKTIEKLLELGFTQEKDTPTLISTWRKKGRGFFFLDCDPSWKRVASSIIQRIIGMSSKQIFPYYPEITASFEKAWNKKGEDTIEIEYGKENKHATNSKTENSYRSLLVSSRFVPPDFMVVYVNDISS